MPSQSIVIPGSFSTNWTRVSPAKSGTGSVGFTAKGRSRTWSNTANFRVVKKAGNLPTRDYTDYQQETYVSTAYVRFPVDGGVFCTTALPYDSPDASVTNSSVLDCLNRAIAGAATKVGGYSFDIGVSAAEAGKTADMIVKAARTLADAAIDVRHGRFAKAAHSLGIPTPKLRKTDRSFESNWLEYRYGWRTTMMDVDGAMKALAEHFISKQPVLQVKSQFEFDDYTSSSVTGGVFQGYTTGCSATFLQGIRSKGGASITYRFRLKNDALAEANSLGLVNPATLAWEVIPYSFVVDWFVNVGECLQNLTSFIGKEYIDGTQCCWHDLEINRRDAVYYYTPPNGSKIGAFGGGGSTKTYRRIFKRNLIPFLSVTPRVNVRLDVFKGVDAVGLLRQILSH